MESEADALLDYMWHYSFFTSQAALKRFRSQKQFMNDSNDSMSRVQEGSSSGSGSISRKEILSALERFPESQRQTVLRRVFEALDEDHNGQISVDELNRQMGRLGFQISQQGIVEIIESADANCDGTLDYPEFLTLDHSFVTLPYVNGEEGSSSGSSCRQNKKTASVVEVFAVFDKDGDGFISAADLRAALICMNMIKAEDPIKCEVLIERVDTDGDGKVSLLDFQNMLGM